MERRRFLGLGVGLATGYGLGFGLAWGDPEEGERRPRKRRNRDTGQTRTIGDLSCSVWFPARLQGAPVLVFSHGFHGKSTQSSLLMAAFAQAGYLVVAPDHEDSELRGKSLAPQAPFGKPEQWNDRTFESRSNDMRQLLKSMVSEPTLQGADFTRIGLVGHSLGGYTCLASAGALAAWNLRQPSLRCVLAWSPYVQALLRNGDFHGIRVPVMYQGGTRDLGITPTLRGREGAFGKTSPACYFVEFEGAGHLAWSDAQRQYIEPILHYSLGFVDRYLRNDTRLDLSQKIEGVHNLEVRL